MSQNERKALGAAVRQVVSGWPEQDLRDGILRLTDEFALMEAQLQRVRSLLLSRRVCSDCQGDGKLRVVRSSAATTRDGPCETCGGNGVNSFVQALLDAME